MSLTVENTSKRERERERERERSKQETQKKRRRKKLTKPNGERRREREKDEERERERERNELFAKIVALFAPPPSRLFHLLSTNIYLCEFQRVIVIFSVWTRPLPIRLLSSNHSDSGCYLLSISFYFVSDDRHCSFCCCCCCCFGFYLRFALCGASSRGNDANQ